jgi:hypothetical protein
LLGAARPAEEQDETTPVCYGCFGCDGRRLRRYRPEPNGDADADPGRNVVRCCGDADSGRDGNGRRDGDGGPHSLTNSHSGCDADPGRNRRPDAHGNRLADAGGERYADALADEFPNAERDADHPSDGDSHRCHADPDGLTNRVGKPVADARCDAHAYAGADRHRFRWLLHGQNCDRDEPVLF